jgi:hypothetical protein
MGIAGWVAAPVPGIRSPRSFLSAAAWLAARAGPEAMPVACHLAPGRSGRFAHR